MELDQLWKSALAELEIQMTQPNFLTWFKNSRLIDRSPEGELVVALSNNFAKEWVENKYHKSILEILISLDDSVRKVRYTVVSLPAEAHKPVGDIKKEHLSAPQQGTFDDFKIDPETNLHPKYTFKSYIVGSSNELAYAASLAVIKDVGKKYNPFFIYGGSGLGKTHLMQSIGNQIKQTYGNNIKVKYIPSEKFVNDIVFAIKNKRMEDMKRLYRSVDVLIIDDIQFIAGKAASEEEFFHTFNALYDNDKQIILSSDRPPHETAILEERLRSRFSSGMIVDISYPDYELRLAIIKKKLEQENVSIPDSVTEFIAEKMQRNIREIEGVLKKILFYQDVKGVEVTKAIVEDIIDKTTKHSFKNVTPNQVMQIVANFFELTEKDLIDQGRRKEVVEPRQITMYLMKDLLGMSYSDIGYKLGKRDHSTVMHACDKISKLLTTDQKLGNKITSIKEVINSK
jgi:chromosomal replication initiator protein